MQEPIQSIFHYLVNGNVLGYFGWPKQPSSVRVKTEVRNKIEMRGQEKIEATYKKR